MKDQLLSIVSFLTDIERLKLVERKAYVSDFSRRENSAEHSWHLAIGLLTVARELELRFDLQKALVMALIHDICELDAGDTPIYGPARPEQREAELNCITRLESYGLAFGICIRELWLEYEDQRSIESRWVKVLDRLMPFIVNLVTNGKSWQEQGICRSQVMRLNEPVQKQAPEIYEWMLKRIEVCVQAGWLRDA
jgi:putative hydrolase of HD superfamily